MPGGGKGAGERHRPPLSRKAGPTPPEADLKEEVVRLRGDLERLSSLYAELLGKMGTFSKMEDAYLRLVALYARYGVVSPEVLVPQATDAMSKEVLRVMALLTEASVQEITHRLREIRGSASRRIVRARLEELRKLGAVELRVTEGGRPLWRLSEPVVRKWAELLGLGK